MSTVFDADTITIDNETVINLVNSVQSITITDAGIIPDVTLNVATVVDTLQIEVPGPQGVQNVYVQSNDPAVEYGWGANEAGFIWIETS